MSEIIIRKAKKSDFDSILKLAKQLWDTEKVFFSNLKDDYFADEQAKSLLLKNILKRKNHFLVAEENNKIIGYIYGYVSRADLYKKKVGYIDQIVVDEEYRRQGICNKLMDSFTKIMKKYGCGYIELNAFKQNLPAVECYKKYGFKEYSVFYMTEL